MKQGRASVAFFALPLAISCGLVNGCSDKQSVDNELSPTPGEPPARRPTGDAGAEAAVGVRVDAGPGQPGDLLEIAPLAPLTQEVCESHRAPADAEARAAYPLRQWKVRYLTRDVSGAVSVASGLLVMPQGLRKRPKVIVYQHGTILSRDAVPSRGASESVYPGCYYATLGAAVIAPDYVGKGDSVGFHPYLHAETEASAAIDLLLATRRPISDATVPSEGDVSNAASPSDGRQVLVTGYSQGGHAALALHRALETGGVPGASAFSVLGSAPMAGPYDLSGTSLRASLIDPKLYDASIYTAFTLASFQRIYGGLWASPSDVFLPSFETLPRLFEESDERGIVSRVPARPADMVRPEWLAALLADSTHPFRKALAANDLTSFVPKAPVLFVMSGSDKVVSPENARVARDAMTRAGASVDVLNVGDSLDHATGFIPSMLATRAFFAPFVRTP